jgi:hypothetical protein
MPATTPAARPFHRDSWAKNYAERHLSIDPGLVAVHYLPDAAPDGEIRFIEVNDLMPEQADDMLEAIDFGVDGGGTHPHRLLILDVTPDQWKRIESQQLPLPPGWSLQNRQTIPRVSE